LDYPKKSALETSQKTELCPESGFALDAGADIPAVTSSGMALTGTQLEKMESTSVRRIIWNWRAVSGQSFILVLQIFTMPCSRQTTLVAG
jgi:hypothetical protein